MASLLFRARNAVLAATLGVAVAPSALAADMPFFAPPAPEPVNEQPVEWGTGWYLRGDVGAAQINVPTLNGANLSNSFPNNWTAGMGGGYQYNNWFRTDVTIDYESLQNVTNSSTLVAPCITNWNVVVINGNTFEQPVWDVCHSISRSRIESAAVLANAYVDLGKWAGFTPYVGVGAGVNVMSQKTQANFYLPNGLSATQTWSGVSSGGQPYYQNLDQQRNGTFLRFAYAFMGGVAYDLTDHIKLDVGYRWMNLGKIDGINTYGSPVSKDVHVHQVRAGFRYTVD